MAPLTSDNEYIEIEAIVTVQTRRLLFLTEYVRNMVDKLAVVDQVINQLVEI